jgi:hypothetical protein
MSGVGFDLEALPGFARALGTSASTLRTLDGDIARLRSEAGALMGGLGVPSDQAAPGATTPDKVAGLVEDAQTEVSRRVERLKTLTALQKVGFGADPTTALAVDLVDEGKVDDAVEALRDLLSKDTGSDGNRDDIERFTDQLQGLNAEEVDAFIDALSDKELADLGAMVNDTDDSGWIWWDHNGLERWQRLEFYGLFLASASPSRIDRLRTAFPGLEPSFDTTDAALDGKNAQTGESALGVTWGIPPGTVFELDENGNPVVDPSQMDQGRLGDCWFIASVLATVGKDPGFIPDHMTVNANGTVSVKLYDHDGNAHWVTVTPELPLDENGDPLGAEGSQLWGSYYEKAFALAYQDDSGGAPDGHGGDPAWDKAEQGTYGALEWDYNDKAAPYITGHDVDGLGHDFDRIVERFDDGHPVIISTPSDAPDPPDDWNGYSTRHVYYVLGTTGDTITVGNPWGSDWDSITMTKDQFDTYFGDGAAIDTGK